MSWVYRNLIRPVLFEFDSETIHNQTIRALATISSNALFSEVLASFFQPDPLPVEVFGLNFPNPIGLAAGMDKHAAALPAWEALGFGFVEIGGVTRHAQPGNPPSRLFRIVPHEALINRMGFNNPGAEAIAQTLERWAAAGRWPNHPVGINLGKSKITPLEAAAEDYAFSFRQLWDRADFFVVNVSSPNTPNLRQLQDRGALDEILAALEEVNREESRSRGSAPKPILVKVAPDLSFEALDEIVELAESRGLAGIVATNTTITRPSSPPPDLAELYAEPGGLSGKPLRARSTEIIRHLHRRTQGRLPIVGVGGIFTPDDAWEKITAGASLLQVYTGLIYEGPGIAKALVAGIAEKLSQHGLPRLSSAVGLSEQL